MFVDQARIFVKAGDGGHGGVSFRREKYVPNGGPDGGNGGKGGNIILEADKDLRTLLAFKYKRKYKGENGQNGSGSRCTGRSGKDLIIKVPVGTIIKNEKTERIIFDLKEHGQQFLAAEGGRGGQGNMNYATATRQAPRFAQGGMKGQEKSLILELKLLADVGLLGFPNVGKSTLLSRTTAAKPKIANYHFTTIEPNLGVVAYQDYDPFIIADIPGIIEGAHQGAGLGYQFLRHIERTKLLIHLLDASGMEGRDPKADFDTINQELWAYNERLAARVQIVALNKIDLCDEAHVQELKTYFEEKGYDVFPISAATGEGLQALMSKTVTLLKEIGEVEPIFDIEPEEHDVEEDRAQVIEVYQEEGKYFVTGEFIERLLQSVNFDDYDSVGYFQRMLKDKGVFKKLEKLGVQDGDVVSLNEFEFEYFH